MRRRRSPPIKLTRLTNTGDAALRRSRRRPLRRARVGRADKPSLWMRQVSTSSNVQIVPPMEGRYDGLSFSPDGEAVLTRLSERLRTSRRCSRSRCSAASAQARRRHRHAAGVLARRDADGVPSRLSGCRARAPSSWRTPTAAISASWRRASARRIFRCSGIAWSPGREDHCRDRRRTKASSAARSSSVDVATGSERTVLPTPDWRQVSRLAWLPDGSGLLVNAQESAGRSLEPGVPGRAIRRVRRAASRAISAATAA